jgi:hypothetical protein
MSSPSPSHPELRTPFPNLHATGFRVTSPASTRYNCIAWAARDRTRFWWPAAPPYWWPPDVPLEETIAAFVLLYAGLGYSPCDDGSLEPDYEKIALHAIDAVVKHAARQLPDGRWTSKLGPYIDIEHTTPAGVEGPVYGKVVRFLKRPIPLMPS